MIKAELENDGQGFRLEITGHAGFAPRGEDLVCAAVSALVYGLAGFARQLEKDGLALPSEKSDIRPGQAVICLYPKAQARERSDGAFALAAEILALLGENFPGNIHFTDKRRTDNDN